MNQLSDECIFFLPYFLDEEEKALHQEFLKMAGNHHYLYRKASLIGKSPLIAEPLYKYVTLDVFYEERNNIFPKGSMETLQLLEGEFSPINSLRYHTDHLAEGKYFEEKVWKHKENIDCFLSSCQEKEYSGSVPLFYIKKTGCESLDYSHVEGMTQNHKWVRQLISFFKQLTDLKLKVHKKLNYEVFLFSKDGEMISFLGYNLISRSLGVKREEILRHNLRVLARMIEDEFYYLYDKYGAGKLENLYSRHNSDFVLLQNAFIKKVPFEDFEEIIQYLDAKGHQQRPVDKIGVFLDTANIYTGLHRYTIHFDRLLTSIYGVKKNIEDQYASIFNPIYESEVRTKAEKARREMQVAELEKQGFEILRAENGTAKAKIFHNGEEMDADDQKLIAKMEERMDKYTRIVVFTGDKHFIPILKKYQAKGVDVTVISIHPDDTSNELVSIFKEHHHFITDYWESIIL